MTKWHDIANKDYPNASTDVLITVENKIVGLKIYIALYVPNLHKFDKYDFPCAADNRPGFVEYDSEWGYCEFHNVTGWTELPAPYKANHENYR